MIAFNPSKHTNMNKFFLSTALFSIIYSVTFAQGETTAKSMFTEKELPSLSIQDIYGKKVDVSSYGTNGKMTVISFWATWCSPCKKELNNISYLYEDWQDDYNMELVAISIDDARNASKVKAYVNGQGWDYEVLLDVNEDLKRLLSFQTVPFTVLVDEKGKIVYSHSGYVEGDEYVLEGMLQKFKK